METGDPSEDPPGPPTRKDLRRNRKRPEQKGQDQKGRDQKGRDQKDRNPQVQNRQGRNQKDRTRNCVVPGCRPHPQALRHKFPPSPRREEWIM